MTRILTDDPVPPIASRSRERPVPCQKCGRVATMDTSAICSTHDTWTQRRRVGDTKPGDAILCGLTWRNVADVYHSADHRSVLEFEAGAVPMIRRYDSGEHVRFYTGPAAR
jgi:hypothetical protein